MCNTDVPVYNYISSTRIYVFLYLKKLVVFVPLFINLLYTMNTNKQTNMNSVSFTDNKICCN